MYNNNYLNLLDSLLSNVNPKDFVKRYTDKTESRAAEHEPDSDSKMPVYLSVKSDKDVSLYFDLPGCKKEDVSAEFDKSILRLSATRDLFGDIQKYAYSVRIADAYDTEAACAKYADGVLVVTIPRKECPKASKLVIE